METDSAKTDTETSAPSLRGLTILITGAAETQGMAIARALGIEGANLHLADGNETALADATRAYKDETKGGIKLHAAQLDRAVGLESLAMECDDAEVIIHAAGAFPDDAEEDATRRAWEKRVLGARPLALEAASNCEDRGRGLILLALPPIKATAETPHPAMARAAIEVLLADEAFRNDIPEGITVETIVADTPDAVVARVNEWWSVVRADD